MTYAVATVSPMKGRQGSDKLSMKMDAVKLVQETLVTLDASAGYVTGAITASRPFIGVAAETVDNSAGSAGDKRIDVWVTGVFYFKTDETAAQTDVGKIAYWDTGSNGGNDQCVIADPGVAMEIGRIVAIEGTTGRWVRIDGYAFRGDGSAS